MKKNNSGLKFTGRKNKVYISTMLTALTLLFSFQNCSQPGSINVTSGSSVADLGDGTNPVPVGPVPNIPAYSSDTFANTELNTPVEFRLEDVSGKLLTGVRVTDQSYSVLNGTLSVVDVATRRFKYTPNLGYRGSDSTMINGVDDKGSPISFNVKISIDNPVQNLKPALAIRGMACIQCHAKVDSNIVTDFGYGNNYFFSAEQAGETWKSGGIYGDHSLSFSTMDLKANTKVIVPKANLPAKVATATNTATLAEYIRSRFNVADVAATKTAIIEEKNKVYIGAPTDADIIAAFSIKATDRSVYFKNSDSSIAISGLLDKTTYFKNNGILNCEGDLALRGPVYFNNLQVNTSSGCRIYVIGSVFIYGSISQTNSGANRNLQITSTKSISMGLGLTKKDNAFCEPNSRFALEPSGYNVSSLKNRYVTFWTTSTYATRGEVNGVTAGNAIMSEAAAIEAGEGLLYDASCRAEGRNVSFDRLLLNAPAIHSRYEGNFIGTVIAEYSIMSLNNFKFQYDAVFDRTPILPMLKHGVYLDIQ